jgi:hypothetical protein
MATRAQIAANRRNAQKSTGPKTPQGKAVVAQNAVKHGFTANSPLLPGEDPDVFEAFKDHLTKELNPKGPTEKMLAERIIDLSWRLKRSGRLHIDAYRVFSEAPRYKHSRGAGMSGGMASREAKVMVDCGQIVVNDFANDKVFERLLIHERRIENSLFKTITELQRLQFIRTKYQSLLMDGVDYDDCETREIEARLHAAELESKTRNQLRLTSN